MKIIILLFIGVIFLAGCTSSEVEFSSMSGQDAYDLIASGTDVTVLDVRSEVEFLSGHIEGAVLLPVNEIEDRAEGILVDKEAVILVICQSGNRSVTASQELANLGFTNVYNIGGILSWPGEIIQ